ncbi:hypothetical protein Mmc1_2991 [Magnetococcus marinus MC-1]|uniref:DUF3108 domain-containing protein n=1 Tax=Magnetococcus marinus (strain ATCC BAA-1437 / JCM 17883 / MC-1) TaxID=156889 RepID=A0LBY9_MAGMM|nr:hypothetical protein [Magnetococcus marinus]ABK45482.1 hypothetical protein Mmc1_2991 [Magnetococcus marinus MC-1]
MLKIPYNKVFVLLALAVAMSGSRELLAAPVWFGGSFRADIIMHSPDKPEQVAKGTLYVGPMRLRAEGTVGNQTRALIMDLEKERMWTLDLANKRYHEGPGRAPMPPMPDLTRLPSDPDHPVCGKDNPAQCVLKGEIALDGIMTQLWEVSMARRGQTTQMQLWVDPQRRVVLKYQLLKGPTLYRKLVEVSHEQGRATEKWQFTETIGSKTRNSELWVDARLFLPVRVVQNGQVTAEIKNIQEMVPDASLFELPKDYVQYSTKDQEKKADPAQQKQEMQFH